MLSRRKDLPKVASEATLRQHWSPGLLTPTQSRALSWVLGGLTTRAGSPSPDPHFPEATLADLCPSLFPCIPLTKTGEDTQDHQEREASYL